METLKLTVGALLRRKVRVELTAAQIKYTEFKGFLESDFVLEATPEQIRAVLNWVARIQ